MALTPEQEQMEAAGIPPQMSDYEQVVADTMPGMPEPAELTDDAALAQATSGIKSLITDRDFKKYVRESETPEPVAEEAAVVEDTMMEENVSPEAATELAALL